MDGPYNSLVEFWRSRLDAEGLEFLQDWFRIEEDKISYVAVATPQVRRTSLAACRPHSSICIIPAKLLLLLSYPRRYGPLKVCFFHNDLTKIVGVLDWTGAYIGPVPLSARFPHDLHTESNDPAPRGPSEYWSSIPYDWTSLGDTSKWPVVSSRGSVLGPIPRAGARFYSRKQYAACVTTKAGLDLATLFDDAPVCLRLHEIITGGHNSWFRHEKWIRATYWILRVLGPGQESCPIHGPQAYTSDGQRVVLDLTLDGEMPYERMYDDEYEADSSLKAHSFGCWLSLIPNLKTKS